MRRLSLIAALIASLTGCETALECGEGTTLIDGVCLLSTQSLDSRCGPYARFSLATGQCEALPGSALCGEGTDTVELDESFVECVCSVPEDTP